MGDFGRLLAFIRPYWRRLAIAVVCLVVSAGLGLVLPWVVRSMIDSVFVSRDFAALNRIVAGLVLVFLVQAVFIYTRDYLLSYVGERTVANLRSRVYDQLMRLSLAFYTTRPVGEIISRVTNDVALIQTTLTANLISLLSQVLTLAGGVIIIVALNWRLTLLMAGIVPVAGVVTTFFSRRLRS